MLINIILLHVSLPSYLFPMDFDQAFVCTSHIFNTNYTPSTSHPQWLITVMTIRQKYKYEAPHYVVLHSYFLPLRSQFYPQLPQTSLMYVLPIMPHKHNLPPVQNNRQNSGTR